MFRILDTLKTDSEKSKKGIFASMKLFLHDNSPEKYFQTTCNFFWLKEQELKNMAVRKISNTKLLLSSDRPKIRFRFRLRPVSAKNKSFGKISVSAKKWPNVRPKPKQPVFLKSNLVSKHFPTFDLYYQE